MPNHQSLNIFSFSTFSTPGHLNNYTPRKLEEKEQELNYFTSRKNIERSPHTRNLTELAHDNDMPLLDDVSFGKTPNHQFTNEYCVKVAKEPGKLNKEKQNDSKLPELSVKNELIAKKSYIKDELKINDGFPFDNDSNLYNITSEESKTYTAKEDINIGVLSKGMEHNKLGVNREERIENNEMAEKAIIENEMSQSPFSKTLEHFFMTQKKAPENDNEANKKNKLDDSNLSFDELEVYINKAEIKQKNKLDHQKRKDCTIDRNLEMALKNKNNAEISLDEIIMTPQGSTMSGASTPTIRNILFGGLTPKEPNVPPDQNILLEDPTKNEEDSNLDVEQFLKKQPVIQNRGKDIAMMKQLVKEELDSEIDDAIVKEEEPDVDSNSNASPKDKDTSQEWDINVSNLLNMGDNEVDLNISISSDFLDDKSVVEPFKRPLTPPDQKDYDLDKFLCNICPKTYESLVALKVHFAKFHNVRIVTPKIRKKYRKVCETCGKHFRDPSNLNKHRMTHFEPVRIHKCTVCQLLFPTQSGLRRHMRWHNDDVQRRLLRSQSKEKAYYCNICGKESKGLGNFKVHLRRHSKNYTTQCSKCGKGFYRKNDLEVHMRGHTGENPFMCELCPKAYKSRAVLKQHMRRHRDEGTYECDVCHLKFKQKYLIKRHWSHGFCPMAARKKEKKYKICPRIIIQKPENHNVAIYHEIGSNEKIKNIIQSNRLRRMSTVVEENCDSNSSMVNSDVFCGSQLDVLL